MGARAKQDITSANIVAILVLQLIAVALHLRPPREVSHDSKDESARWQGLRVDTYWCLFRCRSRRRWLNWLCRGGLRIRRREHCRGSLLQSTKRKRISGNGLTVQAAKPTFTLPDKLRWSRSSRSTLTCAGPAHDARGSIVPALVAFTLLCLLCWPYYRSTSSRNARPDSVDSSTTRASSEPRGRESSSLLAIREALQAAHKPI